MNVFKEMVLSVYSYGSYGQFLRNKKGKVFGFGVLLVTIYFLAACLIPGMINMGSPGRMIQNFRESVPDFRLENGRLWVEEVYEADSEATYVYINTTPGYLLNNAAEVKQYLRGYRQAILMDSEKMILKNNGQVQTLYYMSLDLDISKEDVIELIPVFFVLYVAAMFFSYFWIAGLFFLGALFVALLGLIVAACMNYKIPFGKLYILAVYSRTLPLLIKALVSYLPVGIPFFWVINFGLSLFIIAMALRKMREQQTPGGPAQLTLN